MALCVRPRRQRNYSLEVGAPSSLLMIATEDDESSSTDRQPRGLLSIAAGANPNAQIGRELELSKHVAIRNSPWASISMNVQTQSSRRYEAFAAEHLQMVNVGIISKVACDYGKVRLCHDILGVVVCIIAHLTADMVVTQYLPFSGP